VLDDDEIDGTLATMLRITVTSLALVGLALSVGCSEDCTTVEPAYAGEATDEVWREMLDARADATDGGDAATFTAPDADTAVSSSTSPTFSWDSPLKVAALSPSTTSSPAASSPAASSPSSPSGLPRWPGTWRRRAPSLFDRVVDVVLPAARAHEPPITSDAYFLEVDVPGRTCPVAGLTTALSFTFDDDSWATIATGGGERTAHLLSAFLTENNVTEGPFVAAPLTFTVEP
jgi:hypothetical protein